MCYQIRTGESTSEAVIRTVADATERDPLDLQPIAETIDPDAIDDMSTRSSEEDLSPLELIYEGCRVEVTSDTVFVGPVR